MKDKVGALAQIEQLKQRRQEAICRLSSMLATGLREFKCAGLLNQWTAVSPSLVSSGGWRVTFFDDRGFIGHRDTTWEGVAVELLEERCTIPDQGALARESVKWEGHDHRAPKTTEEPTE